MYNYLDDSANIFPIEEKIDRKKQIQSKPKPLVLYHTEVAFQEVAENENPATFWFLKESDRFLPKN